MSEYLYWFKIKKIDKEAKTMAKFYQKAFINYRGKTIDTNEYYTEIVCQWLLEHPEKISEISQILRAESYKVDTHDGIPPTSNSPRKEELIAMALKRQGFVPGLGTVIDYQTPLNNSSSDNAGKIDLLAYDGITLHILELKKPDSVETMLRCVLESYTYMQTACLPKLINDFSLPSNTVVVANPLVFYRQKQHQELKQDRPWLIKLMDYLNVVPMYLSGEYPNYMVQTD